MDLTHRLAQRWNSFGAAMDWFGQSIRPSAACLVVALTLITALDANASAAESAAKIDFNRDVRPILSDTCFNCHGPDVANIKSNLRLDVRDLALKPAKSGAIAIVPGKPDESELIKRVLTTDEDDVMPPTKLHKALTTAQKETLRAWIAQGATYQGHWAFIAPVRPPVPVVASTKAWVKNPIDAFIAERLAKEGLTPQAEVSREILIRRVSLDLNGLPPTLAEIDAFVADKDPNAFEKVVDRLLSSPRYGEHMATRWLDNARYADSNGFQSDSSRTMWHWRDWVINAFNTNMPFDRFTVEQLAGDLLDKPTQAQFIASGFNRNHRITDEGGSIPEEWRIETVIDRVETTGATWMALTLGCARCHDHKYDPISQREFYQMFAYFNDVEEGGMIEDQGGGNSKPVIRLMNDHQKQALAELEKKRTVAEDAVKTANARMPELQRAWESAFIKQTAQPASASGWIDVVASSVKSSGGATLTKQSDGTWLASGKNADNDTYEITAPLPAGPFTGLRLSVLPDASLPNQSLGRAGNGNFVLSGVEVDVSAPSLAQPLQAEFIKAEASYQQSGWEVDHIVRDQPKPKEKNKAKNKTGWAVDGGTPENRVERQAMFLCSPITVPEKATITIRLVHGSPHADHHIGRFSLSFTHLPAGVVKLGQAKIPESLLAALRAEPDKRTANQKQELTKFFKENADHPLRKAEADLADARKAVEASVNSHDTVMVMNELSKPRQAHILLRGEYDKLGDVVQRALPAALPALPNGAPNNRLGLAKWLVADAHPLTARVWVNRAWEQLFGVGIVKTSENFGSQADWPSHLALLDWLACEFQSPTALPGVAGAPAQRWDMKAVHKLIVMSAAYRQITRATPVLREKDPDNRLLARGPRFRLSAEVLRDQSLTVSGLLVEKVGGPSVRPYMPFGVWDETSVYGNLRNYQADSGEGLYRRTLYTIWKRTAAPPTMLLFDSPSREICTVKRSRTNTPLQALALLNEITYVEAARRLAERMLTEGGKSAQERIAWAFRMVTARRPQSEEMTLLVGGLNKRLAHYRQDPAAAKKLVAQGASVAAATINVEELAAYTTTANVLLNLDEVITRE